MAMSRTLILPFALALAVTAQANGQTFGRPPDTVVVRSGSLELSALVWRPEGRGPSPAVLFNHGSGPASATLSPEPSALGPLFARHGYVFLFLFRRGSGLSARQGANSFDVMREAGAAAGQDARNQVQLRLLETDDLSDAMAGLAFLRALPEVDAHRVVVVGHSFGGSLTLLIAERDTNVRAFVVFGAAAGSWGPSPPLRARLVAAIRRTTAPVFFVYAANDHSVAPGQRLSAEAKRVGKSAHLRIYPRFGRNSEEAHDLVYRGVSVWESDVFAFLDARLRR